MSKVFTFLLSFFLTAQAFAECAMSGLWAYPTTREIHQNSIIVLEGYSYSERIIDSLNIGYPVYLEADGHKVNLMVTEVRKGMFEITQAILKPEQHLIAGKKYYLKIENLNEWEVNDLTTWNDETKQSEPIYWNVTSITDTEIPTWKENPRLVDRTTLWYGCGPAINAVFDLEIQDASKVLIKTELVNLNTNERNTYYLTLPEDGKLEVGHDMCSGAFNYEDKHKYKVRFSLTDLSGNTNIEWTTWINFDSPYEEFAWNTN